MKALIDADVLRYTVGFAAEGEPIENCLHSVKLMINSIVEATQADSYSCFLTGQGNFRETIATIKPYKGNRPDKKPAHYNAITDYIMEHHNGEMVCGMEADDAMGIEQFADYASKRDGEALSTRICTIDKDLDMIPGLHYSWAINRKGVVVRPEMLYEVDMDGADRAFYTQLLSGDTTDNIPGVPGLGKTRATSIINDCQDEEEMYWAALCEYSKKYSRPMEALIENARLLWILRYPGQIWSPWY